MNSLFAFQAWSVPATGRDAVPSVFSWTKQKIAAQMQREERQMQKSAMVTKIAADQWAEEMEEAERNKVFSESVK